MGHDGPQLYLGIAHLDPPGNDPKLPISKTVGPTARRSTQSVALLSLRYQPYGGTPLRHKCLGRGLPQPEPPDLQLREGIEAEHMQGA